MNTTVNKTKERNKHKGISQTDTERPMAKKIMPNSLQNGTNDPLCNFGVT